MGDININFLKKGNHDGIKVTLQVFGLKQLIKSATLIDHHSETLIDIIALNNPSYINESIIY